MNKNGHRLLELSGKTGIITPLVDVLFNLMITMFIFLMIYMVVVIPKKPLPVQLVNSPLPAAAPFIEYLSHIRTTNGSGKFSYICVPGFTTNEGVIDVNRASGEISALFTRLEEAGVTNRTVQLDVLVVDSGMVISVPTNRAVAWPDGGQNAYLYFHEDWPAPEAAALTQKGRGVRTNEVRAFYAVRGTLPITLAPSAVPFAPAENPLCLIGPTETNGIEGVPLETFVVPSGGIPPYEFKVESAPDWLHLDPRTGKLTGVPPRSGRMDLRVSVKDAQTPAARWDQADRLRNSSGHPLVTASAELQVRPQTPLSAKFMLPLYGRVGEAFTGAAIATGGVGRRTFAAESLPRALNLNPDSGEITGIPAEKGSGPIIIVVSDEANHKQRLVTSASEWRGIIEPRPQPGIWGSPPANQ